MRLKQEGMWEALSTVLGPREVSSKKVRKEVVTPIIVQ